MLKIEFTSQFKKDYKAAIKRGCDQQLFEKVVNLLAEQKPLPPKYKDHNLVNSKGFHNVRECHIQPDWLLVYQIIEETLILRLIRTGTHSDLF